jgi:hypothetical protein
MPQVVSTNVSSHYPISEKGGDRHTPPVVAGTPAVSFVVPSSTATLTINGVTTPVIDVRMRDITDIMDMINAMIGLGVTASVDRYGRLALSHPTNAIVVGGDAALRSALGF